MNDRHRRVQKLRKQQTEAERRRLNRELRAYLTAFEKVCRGATVAFTRFADELKRAMQSPK